MLGTWTLKLPIKKGNSRGTHFRLFLREPKWSADHCERQGWESIPEVGRDGSCREWETLRHELTS